AGPRQPDFDRNISEGAVPIVFVKAIARSRPRCLKACAVDKKNIEPAVVVVVEERDAAPGGLHQIAILLLAAENRLGSEPRFLRDVDEADGEPLLGAEQLIQGENGGGPSQGAHEFAP